MKLNSILLAFITITINCSCAQTQNNIKNSSNKNSLIASSDSISLLTLTKNLLKWHEADLKTDFLPISDNDSVYTGINWTVHKTRMEALSKTNFFTQEFLTNYQSIALYLDKELKKNRIKYRKGELPPYGNDANEWCNCQDYPSDINQVRIKDINCYNNLVTYTWIWGDDLKYYIKAKKIKGQWKIAYLERFDIKNYVFAQ